MAIVHISTKAISRKAGQSAVASASYRAGDRLYDEQYDKTHDYSKKSGVMSADIILPSTLQAKGFQVSRSEIWNKAEKVEGRKDSRVAREWLINLPHELDEEERKALAHTFSQTLADKYNVIADCAIHKPSKKEIARGADPRNYHAHILVTTREAKLDANGSLFFDPQLKIPFEWSNKKRENHGLISSVKEIKNIRQLWVDMANEALAEHDCTPLDARSFKGQGLDLIPTIKMGVDATHMERKGIITHKGNMNRAIHERNERVAKIKKHQQRTADERQINEHLEWTGERVEWAAHRGKQVIKCVNDSQQRINRSQRRVDRSRNNITWSIHRVESINKNSDWAIERTAHIINRVAGSKSRVAANKLRANEVNKVLNKRADRPATPSPFDEHAKRARATRLTEQERQFDRAATEYDRSARYQDRGVEQAYKRAELNKQQLAYLLLSRSHEKNRLRPGWREKPDDYPDKFDYRQSDLLDLFAQNIEMDKNEGEDYRDYQRRIAKVFTADFRSENQAMIDLLRDPKTERAQYNAVKKGFDDFLQALDKYREDQQYKIRLPIHKLNATTDMVKNVATAVDYLHQLDNYIESDTIVKMNKALAIEHRVKTINRTVEAYKYACQGIPNFQDTEIHRTHTETLQGSLDDFTSQYGNELSKEQQQTIQSLFDGMNEPSYRNSYRPNF